MSLTSAQKAWRSANREKINAKNREYMKSYKYPDPTARAEYMREYYVNNASAFSESGRAWRAANRERHLANAQAWADANRHKVRAIKARYASRNPGKVNAKTRARQAAKLRAMPSWANLFFMEEAYDLAVRRTKCTGIEWEVDHIVPLQGKTVCGLHVEHNLQVIPAAHNRSKGNRYWPDMP